MLMRFDPFRDLDRVTEQMLGGGRVPVMPMDAYRRGDEFVVELDLPGVDARSIDLTIEKNVLSISAERTGVAGEGAEVVAAERPQGRFGRQLFLGEGLDAEGVDARYEQGVLIVRIPVAEQAKPRKVDITASEGDRHSIETSATEG
jgi:HSP20 family protein